MRVVVSEKSNSRQATAALKHRYADLLAAGVEVWELPGTVVHAKVVVADDVVSFGTVNLDAWALLPQLRDHDARPQRRARGAARGAAVRARHRPRGPRRAPARPRERLEGWLCDKLAYYL